MAQTSLRKPSRAKQELRQSYVCDRGRVKARKLLMDFDLPCAKRLVDELFEPERPLVQLAVRSRMFLPRAEALIRQVERDENREA